MSYDLAVCVRCHVDPSKIIDTLDSARWSCDPDRTVVFAAVDGVPVVAKQLQQRGKYQVHCSGVKWGWGAGLWTLMVEAIEFAEKNWKFSHFLSVDYDTLFLAKGVDRSLLDCITSDRIGLIGSYRPRNDHWAVIYDTEKARIEKTLGLSVPRDYNRGEGVQGGVLLLTRAFIDTMKSKKFFDNPVRTAKRFTSIADDHLIPLWCRYCRLDIHDAGTFVKSSWHACGDPRGMEKKGVKIFHPIKLTPQGCGNKTEWELRNYFRKIRGQEPVRV